MDEKEHNALGAGLRLFELVAFYNIISRLIDAAIKAIRGGKTPQAFLEENYAELQGSVAHFGGGIGGFIAPKRIDNFTAYLQDRAQKDVDKKNLSKDDKSAAQKFVEAIPAFAKNLFTKTFATRSVALVKDEHGITVAHMHDPRCATWDGLLTQSPPKVGMTFTIVALSDVPEEIPFAKCCRFEVTLGTAGTKSNEQAIIDRLRQNQVDEIEIKRLRRLKHEAASAALTPTTRKVYPTEKLSWLHVFGLKSFEPTHVDLKTGKPVAEAKHEPHQSFFEWLRNLWLRIRPRRTAPSAPATPMIDNTNPK